MRVPTTLAAMPLLLTLPLQSRCSPPPMAGVITLYNLDGEHCGAKATDVLVPDVKQGGHLGGALWLVMNACETGGKSEAGEAKSKEQKITVGRFRMKGTSQLYKVVYDCEGLVFKATSATPGYISLKKGEAGILRCEVHQPCAPPNSYATYRYGVCANGSFLHDPDLRVKGGGKGGVGEGCEKDTEEAAKESCAAATATP